MRSVLRGMDCLLRHHIRELIVNVYADIIDSYVNVYIDEFAASGDVPGA